MLPLAAASAHNCFAKIKHTFSISTSVMDTKRILRHGVVMRNCEIEKDQSESFRSVIV